MKINRKDQKKEQTVLLSIVIEKSDYADSVSKQLKDYRRKANIPGFRVGHAPMGLIEKTYGKQTLVDTTYRMATDAAFEELKKEEIDPIGDLMPAESQPKLDFDSAEEFEFIFEIGLAPKVEVDFTKEDKITRVVLKSTAEMVSGYTENYLRRFGKLEDVEAVTKDEALTVVLDNKDMRIEDAYVGLISMSDEERAPFIGAKVGDKLNVNVNELYKDPKQRAAILSLKDEELEGVNPEFEMEITQVRAFVNPEIDEEFLAMAFPEGGVKDKKAFDKKMKQDVEKELAAQVEFKWDDNVRDYALEKAALSLPSEFLKRWLFSINEGKFSMEQIEEEFPQFEKMMKWDLVKREMVKKLELEVTEEDVVNEAKEIARAQFRQYGMASVGDDMLENYAKQILSNKEEARKLFDRAGEKKIVSAIADLVEIKDKKMSVEEFSAMLEKERQ